MVSRPAVPPWQRLQRTAATALFLAGAVLAVTPAARAQVVLYTTGFEPPTFTAGNPVAGQDGWSAPIGAAAGAIATNNPRSGAQALQVSGRLLENDGEGTVAGDYGRELRYDTQANRTPLLVLRADVRLDGPSTAGMNRGTIPPVLDDLISANIAALDGNNAVIAFMYFSSNGNAYAGNGAGANGYQFPTPVTLGQYATLGMDVNFATRATTFSVNGRVLGTLPFPTTVQSNTFGVFDLSVAAYADRSIINPDPYTGYFDNYSVQAVPEPSGLAVLGFGCLGLLGVRAYARRRARPDANASRA
jgi:hypothetical protein